MQYEWNATLTFGVIEVSELADRLPELLELKRASALDVEPACCQIPSLDGLNERAYIKDSLHQCWRSAGVLASAALFMLSAA